jgi:hypothetical protein
MSEDPTQALPKNGKDNSEILKAIKTLDMHVINIDSRLQNLEETVDGLEKTVAERLHDTRPIWHKVADNIAELQAGQKRLEEGQQVMRLNIMELSNTVRNVNRDQIIINDVVRRIQLDFHNIDERLHKLILNRDQPNSST